MKSFDTIYAVVKTPPLAKKSEKKLPLYYFYKSLQIVISFWIVTILAITAIPWLDYAVKSSINHNNGSQILGESAPKDPESTTPAAIGDVGTFYLKNDKLEINAPIIEGVGEDSLSRGIGHHPDSAWFGEKGNVVLAGHNTDLNAENPYGKVFLKLRDVSIGDQVIINYQDKNYYYKVFKNQTISPKDTSLFGPADDWMLTFYTCDPPYTDWKRIVYQAKLEKIE